MQNMLPNELAKKHKYYNNKFFGRWARLYDYEKYFLFPIRQKAAKFFPLKAPAKILDVATGTGAQAYELAKLGFDVTGVDLSPEMLEQAKKKLGKTLILQFLHADGTKLPFANNEFDGASISLGLHDMPYEIGLAVLSEIKRVVKDRGSILIVDYMEPKKHIVGWFTHPFFRLCETPHYDLFIKKGLERYLQQVNLRVNCFTHFLGIFQIVLITNTT